MNSTLIVGDYGVGKTLVLTAKAKELARKGYVVHFINASYSRGLGYADYNKNRNPDIISISLKQEFSESNVIFKHLSELKPLSASSDDVPPSRYIKKYVLNQSDSKQKVVSFLKLKLNFGNSFFFSLLLMSLRLVPRMNRDFEKG